MSKKVNYEEPQKLIALKSNHALKVVYKKKIRFNINYGIVTNTIIIISMILFISICYTIGGFLADPLIVVGVILIIALFSIFILFSILEKEGVS